MLSAVAWPVVVLILGLVAIFVFRAPLYRFLDRAEEISKTGVRAGASKQLPETVTDKEKANELLRSFDNALLVKNEASILDELAKRKIDQSAERERILLRFLAGAAITSSFDRTYAAIWGSQIAAIEFLNEAGDAGIDPELLRPWYDQAAAQNQQLYDGYPFENWLSFLERSLLIHRIQDKVAITLEGREFLKFVVHQGYTRFKQG